MGIGELYALLCAITWAVAIVLFRHAGTTMSADSLNLVKNTFTLILLIPTAFYIDGFTLPKLSLYEWSIIIVTGYFGIAIADSWYLQTLRLLGASRTAVVASLYSPFVVILSILVLGEVILYWKWFGLILVIFGICVVTYQRLNNTVDQQRLYHGIAYGTASVFLTALGVVLMKPILAHDQFFWIVTLRLVAGTVGLIAVMQLQGKLSTAVSVLRNQSHPWKTILIASFFGTYLGLTLWMAGFKYTQASTASVINETSNLFIVLLAWIFLKEHLNSRKVFGIVIAFTGVIIFIS